MTTLIAREAQFSQLNRFWQQTVNGRCQIVFITGEAGVGKTTLIQSFVNQVQHKRTKLLTASSRCHAISGGQQEPYLPFGLILEALATAQQGDNKWDKLRRGMIELAPDWLQAIPGVGDVAVATWRTLQWGKQEYGNRGPGTDTNQRMVQYTHALQLAAEAIPLLLWIDDIHWADKATLELISFLADQARNSRIMLIATYRPTDILPGEAGQPHPVRQLVDKLARYQQCQEITVPTFALADVKQFLEMSRHQLPDEFVERIWQQSGGNPLFVREYVNLLHSRKLLKRRVGNFTLAQPTTTIEIPATVQSVVEQRLSLIGADLQRTLTHASVQGERFTAHILAQLLKGDEAALLEQLRQLEKQHYLIHEVQADTISPRLGAHYEFAHALVQDAIYQTLGVGQRHYLHHQVAELLESSYGSNVEQQAATIAVHFKRGNDAIRAIPYYLQAGQNALFVLALDDALAYAQTAVRLITEAEQSDVVDDLVTANLPTTTINRAHLRRQLLEHFNDSELRDLCFDLSVNYDLLPGLGFGDKVRELIAYCERNGRLDELVTACAACRPAAFQPGASSLAGPIGSRQKLVLWSIEALLIMAKGHFIKAEVDLTLVVCQQGELLCVELGLKEKQAAFLYWRSRVLSVRNDFMGAYQTIVKAIDLLGDSPLDPVLQGHLFTRLGSLYGTIPSSELRAAHNKALTIATENNLPELQMEALLAQGWVALNQESSDEAFRLGEQGLGIAQRYNLLNGQIASHRLLVYAGHRLNRGEEALLHSEEAVKLARKYGLPGDLHQTLYDLSFSWRLARQEWPKSLELAREAVQVAETYRFEVNQKILSGWFEIAFALGMWAEATEILGRYRKNLLPSAHRGWGFLYRRQGHLAFARGLVTEAVTLYEQGLGTLQQYSPEEDDAKRVQPYLGLALVEAGRVAEGQKHLGEAYHFWKDRSPARTARCLHGLARAELALEHPHQAVTFLQEASSLAEAIQHNESTAWPIRPQIAMDFGLALLQAGKVEEALEQSLAGYDLLKRWGHFLFGRAAFIVGQILVAQERRDEALVYLRQAHDDWVRLELEHHLPAWLLFVQEHKLPRG